MVHLGFSADFLEAPLPVLQLLSGGADLGGLLGRHINVDAAHSVHRNGEDDEVHAHVFVDFQSEVLLDGLGQKIEAAVRIGCVQLGIIVLAVAVFVPAGDGNRRVPQQGAELDGLVFLIDGDDNHGVRPSPLLHGASVDAQQQQIGHVLGVAPQSDLAHFTLVVIAGVEGRVDADVRILVVRR